MVMANVVNAPRVPTAETDFDLIAVNPRDFLEIASEFILRQTPRGSELPAHGKHKAHNGNPVQEKLTWIGNILSGETRLLIAGIVTRIPLDSVPGNGELWSIRV